MPESTPAPTYTYNSRQEVFDSACTGLASQSFQRSLEEPEKDRGYCAYRGTENRRCAIGHLIPDSLYNPNMEGHPARVIRSDWPEVAALFNPNIPVDFLPDLQLAHDYGITPDDMKDRLRCLGQSNNLTLPACLA